MPTTYKTPGGSSGRDAGRPAGRTGAGSTTRPARRRIAGERRPQGPAPTATSPTRTSPTGTAPTGTAPTRTRSRRSGTAVTDRAALGNGAPQQTRERASTLMLVVATVLLVAVAVTGTFVVRDRLQAADAADRAAALDSALTEAPARAEKAAAALLSYRHDAIGKDIDRATPYLTDKYAEDYTTTMREVVADPAKKTKATVKATVLSSGVVDASPQRTDVLVFVNQVTESTNSDQPTTALNRAILTMVKRDGQWVVSELKGL